MKNVVKEKDLTAQLQKSVETYCLVQGKVTRVSKGKHVKYIL